MTRHYPLPFALYPISYRFISHGVNSLLCALLFLVPVSCLLTPVAVAQSVSATLSGTVVDENGAVVPAANVTLLNDATSFKRETTTDNDGYFAVPLLPPGTYRLTAAHTGFKTVEVRDIILNVNDARSLKIQLKTGDILETVNITSEASLINESPAVATVVDQNLVSRIPLNGRTIQNLIALTPGAIPYFTGSGGANVGQISVNGLRTTQNYMTIDGASSNLYVGSNAIGSGQTNGLIPGFSQLGTTSNLVSVDALQEFKVQTSSFAAEFGRTPGAQIQLTTRSGTNDWHGSAFEYFRNDKLDATDWFVNANRLAKPPLRHNDFGGTFSGPVILPKFGEGGPALWKGTNRTFFFFSYEGTRIRLPQVLSNAAVPSRLVRQTAHPSLRPFLAAFPEPTGPDAANGLTAPFSISYSNPQTQDATSIRIDHVLTSKIALFGRYNFSPQENLSLQPSSSQSFRNVGNTKTLTLGLNLILTPMLTNEFRFNWSRNYALSGRKFVSINGTTEPPRNLLFPAPLTEHSGSGINFPVTGYFDGAGNSGERRQINITDTLSWVRGNHLFKFGFDYRRSPSEQDSLDLQLSASFFTLAAVQTAIASSAFMVVNNPRFTKYQWSNFGAFAQDTWKLTKRLTLDYGLRWDVNPPPDVTPEPRFVSIDFVSPALLAPPGSKLKLYPTIYTGFAPRLGAAYLLRVKAGQELVVRGGYGLFYDIGSGSFGNVFQYFPYTATTRYTNVPYPLSQAVLTPPVISTTPPYSQGGFLVQYDKGYVLPRVHQWNLALQQGLGREQTLTLTYVGNAGRRFLRLASLSPISRTYPIPSPDFPPDGVFNLNSNREDRADSSDYHAMQVQFNRRGKRVSAIVNYTWSHAIDTGSAAGSLIATSFFAISPRSDRGDASFDRRHVVTAAFTWNLPAVAADGGGLSRVLNAVTRDWSLDGMFQAQTSYPFEPVYTYTGLDNNFSSFLRPDRVPGVPLWIPFDGPTGRRVNPAAFSIPTTTRQGNLPRNSVRVDSLWQPDIAVSRTFVLTERIKLRFRAEMFNVVNHPMFSTPGGTLGTKQLNGTFTPSPTFGRFNSMLNRSGATEGIALSSIYAPGGPRSIQFGLRLSF